jgi:alpha/beta superfamily hydrolase
MSYTEEEVAFANSEITLAGTLTLPEGPASCPAVVLLQGSGPLNRDEELFGRKPFAIIADFFARNGIAVLRYDSRGVGGSTGAPFQYTLSDVAEDALAALRYMKARDEIDAAQIGLCGHSQGGIVAPICAARSDDVAFIICVAGIGTTGEETFLSQVRSVAVADGESEDRIDMRVRSMKRILELIRGGAGRAELEPEVLKVVQLDKPPMPVAADGPRNDGDVDGKSEADRESRITGNERAESDSEDAVRAELSCHLDLFSSPWFRSFLDHDAQPVL